LGGDILASIASSLVRVRDASTRRTSEYTINFLVFELSSSSTQWTRSSFTFVVVRVISDAFSPKGRIVRDRGSSSRRHRRQSTKRDTQRGFFFFCDEVTSSTIMKLPSSIK